MMGSRTWSFLFVSAPFSGIEVFCRNIQQFISEREEIDATWIWIENQPKELIGRIAPIRFNWTLKGGLVARSRVKDLEKAGKRFDAVFFNHTIPATFLSKFRKRVPMVLSMDVTPKVLAPYNQLYRGHETNTRQVVVNLKNSLIQSVYRDAAYILPWSNIVRDSLVHDYNINPDKVVVVPPGINLKQWTVSSTNNRSLEKGSPYVKFLFVGGDFHRKGGDVLLRVAQREEFRDCQFHFVTKTFQGTPGRNCIVHDNLGSNSTQLIDLYYDADIFVLPTRADLAPTMVLCEAMAMGLPVVSTNVGGLEEIVKHGETGIIVPVGEEESLASALRTLRNDRELRQKLGSNARKLVESKYSLEKNIEKILYYMKLAAEEKKSK
jgi:glycosyltransferase involved in cell wall biosynthesis